MRKTRWFAVLIFLLLFSTCNAFAEEVRQSRVNQVSVTYQMKNRKWGFIDILTGYNSGPQYDDIYDDCYESDSPIFVMKDGLWGYVNRVNGEIVIDFQFSSVYGHPCFRHGYALVSNVVEGEDNSIRYDSFLIDTTGRKIELPNGYHAVTTVCGTENTIVIGGDDANSDYRYGLYRIGEGIVVSPSFYEICAGDCNYYCFRDDSGRIGMIDRNGNVVLTLAYTDENSTILYMSRSSQRGYTYFGGTGYYSIELEDGSKIFIVIDDDSCTYNVITVP